MLVSFYPKQSGLTLEELEPRLYMGGNEIVSTLALTESSISTGYYTININIDALTPADTLTINLDGVEYIWRWGVAVTSPDIVIIPYRVSGETLESLNIAITKDLEPVNANTIPLTLSEIGNPGDYALSGWNESGRWIVYWETEGVGFSFEFDYVAEASIDGLSYYLEILAVQRPFPFNTDEAGRIMVSTNYNALAENNPNLFWEGDLAKLITEAGLGVPGVNLFGGGTALQIPLNIDNEPYINIIDTGGGYPEETHNGNKLLNLSAQIIVRASDFTAAQNRAIEIFNIVDGVRNRFI